MDILANSTYLLTMFSRLIRMLAILAITVVTAMDSAHAVGMGSGSDHAMHVGEMMHSTEVSEHASDAGQHCGPDDVGICEFVCGGLSALLLTSPCDNVEQVHRPASHGFPSAAIHVSRTPGLNKRPPKLRLL